MKHKVKHIHFVGIGGSGMSGIAEIYHHLGYIISGSDQSHPNSTTTRLTELGIKIFGIHHEDNVKGADVVVLSTAINSENPENKAAHELQIPVVQRATMLAELMRFRESIAIAGTHGKTTTTSLMTHILAAANLDPTFVIGGKLNSMGTNGKLGLGKYMVVEADESDASFLKLLPMMAVITNIDEDHMDTYQHDIKKLHQAFIDFVHKTPFYGSVAVCVDDIGVQTIIPQLERTVLTYGIDNPNAHFYATNIQAVGTQMHFDVIRNHQKNTNILSVKLNTVGQHNVKNALACIAIADELEISDEAIIQGLADFKGVGRRFQQYGKINVGDAKNITVIDDYGHHPIELKATLEAARGAYPNQRLMLAFQPHRFTRTRDLFEDFADVLSSVDGLILTEVYAAGETKIANADGRSLARQVRLLGKVDPIFMEEVDDIPEKITPLLQENDVLLCMGAGTIGKLAQLLVEKFSK